MKNLLLKLWREEEGQDLTEYALLMVLVALAAVASINGLATAIEVFFPQQQAVFRGRKFVAEAKGGARRRTFQAAIGSG